MLIRIIGSTAVHPRTRLLVGTLLHALNGKHPLCAFKFALCVRESVKTFVSVSACVRCCSQICTAACCQVTGVWPRVTECEL
eukprot:2966259-Rhodomonas_salina.1